MPKTQILRLDKPMILSVENFGGVQEIFDIDEKNQIIRTTLMELDYITRNRAMYDAESFCKSLQNSQYINELIAQGMWTGELEHPDAKCSHQRFMSIDDTRISHRIINYKIKGKVITGLVQFISPLGHIPWDWIHKHMNIAFSVRVLTPHYLEAKDDHGNAYLKKTGEMHIVTYDCVKMPGVKIARAADPAAFAQKYNYQNMDVDEYFDKKRAKEAYEQLIIPHKEWKSTLSVEEFKHILSTEDASLKILEEVYDFDAKKSKIVYNANGTVSIGVSSTESINLPVDVYELMKVTEHKHYSMTGRSFTENIPSYSKKKVEEEERALEELEKEFSADWEIANGEEVRGQEKAFARLVTFEDYQKNIRPDLMKEIDYIYSNWDKILREAFDQIVEDTPQKYKSIYEKHSKDKIFAEFKKLYKLSEKSKVVKDIDNYVYRKTGWHLSVKENGKYIPLVQIRFANKTLREITTKEDENAPKWGWATIIFALMPIIFLPAFVFTFAMWIHCKVWRGYHISKVLQRRLRSVTTLRYATIKQFHTQTLPENRDHMLMYKLNFKISKKEMKYSKSYK